MSNTVVGGVYAQIIDKIIAEAKNDFEEAGLDQETLQELKHVGGRFSFAYLCL